MWRASHRPFVLPFTCARHCGSHPADLMRLGGWRRLCLKHDKRKNKCSETTPHLRRAEASWSWPSSWKNPHCQRWGWPRWPSSWRCCHGYWGELCLRSGQCPPLCWPARSPVSEAGFHWPLGLVGWGRETNVLLHHNWVSHESLCSWSVSCRPPRHPETVSKPSLQSTAPSSRCCGCSLPVWILWLIVCCGFQLLARLVAHVWCYKRWSCISLSATTQQQKDIYLPLMVACLFSALLFGSLTSGFAR